MSRLIGADAARKRLHAIEDIHKPILSDWADETVRLARGAVPVRTGRLRRSIAVGRGRDRQAVVVAHPSMYFVDRGTRAHPIEPQRARVLAWQDRGPRFAKRVSHPRTAARPFRDRVTREALSRTDMGRHAIDAWNGAA